MQVLSLYLLLVVVASLAVSLLVFKLKFPKPRVVIPVAIAIVLVPALLGYLYVTYFTSIPETTVPDLSGLPLETALERLEALDLKGKFAGSLFNMRYPDGSVISQQPESGRRVKVGRVVSLMTSSGKRKVQVPNLLGRPAIQAEAVLLAKGLRLGEVASDYVPELEPGMILSQNPLPGDELDTGSLVRITISATEEPVVSAEAVVGEESEDEDQGEEQDKDEQGGFWPWE
ncbi:PASTA domain-containing protein [Candidatus Margulisiibacteriota bacterium]